MRVWGGRRVQAGRWSIQAAEHAVSVHWNEAGADSCKGTFLPGKLGSVGRRCPPPPPPPLGGCCCGPWRPSGGNAPSWGRSEGGSGAAPILPGSGTCAPRPSGLAETADPAFASLLTQLAVIRSTRQLPAPVLQSAGRSMSPLVSRAACLNLQLLCSTPIGSTASRHVARRLLAHAAVPAGQPGECPSQTQSCTSRRAWLATVTSLAAAALVPMPAAAAAASSASQDVAAAEAAAARAYANRDFEAALAALDELVRQEPQELRWREMRAQVGGWDGSKPWS